MRLSLLLLNLNILTKTVDGSDLFKVHNVSCMYITRLTMTRPFFSLIQLVHPLRTLLSFSILGVFRWRFRVRLSILPLPSTPIHLNFFDTRHSSLTHPTAKSCSTCTNQRKFDGSRSSTFTDERESSVITFGTGVGVDPVIGVCFSFSFSSRHDS